MPLSPSLFSWSVPSQVHARQRERCVYRETSAPSLMDWCQQPQIMQSSAHFVVQVEPENVTQSRWGPYKTCRCAYAQPSLPCAPANKQLIVQPCKSHDITRTEAAICVKTNLVPRIARISKNPQLLKAIVLTLPTILSRFSFLLI